MPVNPIQRRIKNSFLVGFFIAVLIMAVFVVIILLNTKKLKEENARLIALQKPVYVAATDLESGTTVTLEDFTLGTVQTSVNPEQMINEDTFSFVNEEGVPEDRYNEDGSIKEKQLIVKVNIPAGTIVTKDMLAESEEEIANDVRIHEFHMISLPSQLEEGDYIDIRWAIPQGQDYIVLAKKKVLKTTTTGIWLKLSQAEILTMNNAIVEAYTVPGSKLYALEYNEPGIQAAAEPTYPVNGKVLELIEYDPNIINTAKEEIKNRLYANNLAAVNQRNTYIDPVVTENSSAMAGSVQSRNQEEISKIKAERENYLKSLDG